MNRKKWTQYRTFAAFGFFATLGCNSIAGVSAAEWTSRFSSTTGDVQAVPDDRPRIVAGLSGQTFAYGFVEAGRQESSVTRFGGDISTPVWSATESYVGDLRAQARLFPLPDGSSIHLSASLSRFASDGSLAWSMPTDDLEAMILLPTGDVLTAFRGQSGLNGGVLRLLSATTGATLDAIRIGGGCSDLKLASSAPDIAYLWSGCSSRQVIRLRTNPLRVEWMSASNEPTASLINGAVADASGVYLASSNGLRKLSAVDGQTLWEAAPVSGFFNDVAIDGAGNIVTSGANIDQWDGTTGANLWHYPEIATAIVDPVLSAVFFAGALPRETPADGFVGLAGRLDLSNGNVVWRREMPAGANIRFTEAALSGNDLQLIGLECTVSIEGPCTTLLWSTDAATGNTFQSAPLVSKTGTVGTSILEEGDRTLAAAIEWSAAIPQIHLRSHANDTGMILQESVTPFQFASVPWPSTLWVNLVRSNDGNVVVTAERVGGFWPNEIYGTTIVKIEAATGQLLWQKFLIDSTIFQRAAHISPPVADPEGNIILGVLEEYAFDTPNRRWVRKFNHNSGELMWEREMPAALMSSSYNTIPAVFALGSDVTTETPLGDSGSGSTALSGADGTTRWSNPDITGRIQTLDESTAISYGTAASQIIARRFNMSTGAVLWTSIYSHSTDVSYAITSALRGDQDDFYIGGTHRRVLTDGVNFRGLLLRLNLVNGDIVWANRLEEGPVEPRSRVNPRFVHNGKVFATQNFFHTYGYALSAFSIDDGAHAGSAYLHSSPLAQPHLPQHANTAVAGMTSTGQLMITGNYLDPGLPGELVLANWGTPVPAPNGALRVALDLEAAGASPWITYAYAFETINEGTVTANDVQALFSLPAGTMVESASCQLSGSPCVAITTATSVEGIYTIPAGATLRIEGIAKLIPANDPLKPQWFQASAFAPHTFAELDLKDNVASAQVADLIFRSNFD